MIKYAITSPAFFKTRLQKKEYLKKVKANFVLFRDKESADYEIQAKDFLQLSRKLPIKKILHQDYKLAFKLRADGVHLTSKQFKDIKKAKRKGLFTIVSTHSILEIKKAKHLGADAVTFSPIFPTPNKGRPKGVIALKKAVRIPNIKVIALGGIIGKKEIKKIEKSFVFGFASIRFF